MYPIKDRPIIPEDDVYAIGEELTAIITARFCLEAGRSMNSFDERALEDEVSELLDKVFDVPAV